jgi:RNA recognition motif-containing protein
MISLRSTTSTFRQRDQFNINNSQTRPVHSLPVTNLAFLYDIPKISDRFTNRIIKERIELDGFKGCQVQIIKDEDNKKPFWSGRVRF